MKSFWQRSHKKSKKKKRKPNVTSQNHALQSLSKPKPAPWVPPHPIIPKTPSIGDGFLSKPAIMYQLPASFEENGNTSSQTPAVPDKKVIPHKDDHIRKEFMKVFRSLIDRWRSWDIWTDFVTMVACTISNSVDKLHYDEREKTYRRIISKYSKRNKINSRNCLLTW